MKRNYYAVLLGLAVAAALTGCGSDTKKTETEFSTAAPEEFAEEDVIMEEEYVEEESEVPLEPITPSDYLVENAGEYVTLGSMEGLEVTQYTYKITDELVQEMIDSDLQMSSIETDVDRAAATDDVIYVDLTYAVQGSSDSTTESTYFYLGMEEYGAEFDQALIGLSVGDTKEFSITFDDSAIMAEWMNETVDFEVTVTSVCEVSAPEYTDTYVQDYFGYDTIAEYEAAIKESMEYEYEDISYSDTIEALFDAAAEQCTFNGYPQELYDSCKEELLSFYLDYTEGSDIEEVYELFGFTEEDLETDVLYTVNRRLLVSKLCEEKDIQVTSDEYVSYVEEYASYYGYGSASSFEADYGRTSLVWTLYESKVGELLYESAIITEEAYEEAFIDDVEFLEEDDMIPEDNTEEFSTEISE